ncbi:pyruvate dehydrogenase complex dihydrolipoamide acetyltransferase [Phaeodactylibacter luteus]|uniref:Acetyltransferase component of pyruvate dehydrogenase complex n=1 Tax=Phaeodactylibacter luteus TaxID=1564516 RepID=A0A5C6RFV8_9BACT|nr:pyruvate dehydrogenase complex dihydrolipoamide acetyltransferase [Phaeodactylibacter luteus]TXB59404.1 pyruvate dehydrogenase complex dihydrolipoamide acetyltransferase [Phaeodactylibacter luteus]
MAEVIRMPRMSDTMEEGNIVSWLKAEGDEVEAGETLAEVETDKATMELDSYFDGVLLHIAVKEGPVPINGVIAVIGEEGEDWKAAIESSGDGGEAPAAEQQEGAAEEAAAPVQEESSKPAAPSSDDDQRVKASPLARSMAKDAGIDLSAIAGSGDGGRIVKRDVEEAISQQQAAPQPKAQPAAPQSAPAAAPQTEAAVPNVPEFSISASGDNYEDQPVSQMRKTIARRLGESKFSAPHFYLTVEINMGNAIQVRKRINEVAPTKISFNDLVVKACAVALRKHPAINSSWLGDKIRLNKDVNVGVAVAVEDGLLVPVIRFADMKSLSQINTEVKTLAGKAKSRKLSTDEMTGNTFTISNLGMFGIEEFTAIINPPDACILAVGGIIQKPIVKDGELAVGNMMKVTLSCDHRVVDGATGAQFLQTVKEILEDPIRILV